MTSQSTCTPRAWTSAADVMKRASVPSSRRSEPATTTASGSATAASIVSCTAHVSAGCGLHSMNVVTPSPASRRIACSKRTGSRRLRYQCSAPSSGPSTSAAVVVDSIAIVVAVGTIGARSSSSRARIASTCSECEA